MMRSDAHPVALARGTSAQPGRRAAAGAGVPARTTVLADAHVHFHRCFMREPFFDAALANFRLGARDLGLPSRTPGLLLLAESRGERWFERFREEAEAVAEGGGRFDWENLPRWSFLPSAEPGTLLVRRGRERLFLVAGRQIVVREGLEVLALATAEELPDGLPLADTLEWTRERGAVAVLPWGFGKWWFGRGRLLAEALRRLDPERTFLGDSACRPALAPDPRPFREARSRRIHVLPGTDPLPLADQVARPGSYGFVAEGFFDERRPAASLRRMLASRQGQPDAFGRRTGLLDFARDQAAMQARKRVG